MATSYKGPELFNSDVYGQRKQLEDHISGLLGLPANARDPRAGPAPLPAARPVAAARPGLTPEQRQQAFTEPQPGFDQFALQRLLKALSPQEREQRNLVAINSWF